jgi:hypothetical protein
MDSSPPVVIRAPNVAVLAGEIVRADVALDERMYWPKRLDQR